MGWLYFFSTALITSTSSDFCLCSPWEKFKRKISAPRNQETWEGKWGTRFQNRVYNNACASVVRSTSCRTHANSAYIILRSIVNWGYAIHDITRESKNVYLNNYVNDRNQPDKKSFSIISKLLDAGPRVASCLVAFLKRMGRTVIPIEGSICAMDMRRAVRTVLSVARTGDYVSGYCRYSCQCSCRKCW